MKNTKKHTLQYSTYSAITWDIQKIIKRRYKFCNNQGYSKDNKRANTWSYQNNDSFTKTQNQPYWLSTM